MSPPPYFAEVDFAHSVTQLGAQNSIASTKESPYGKLYAKRYGVDGGIGVGKTSIIKSSVVTLKESGLNARGLMEHPNNEMRSLFYDDKDKEALSFQCHMLGKRQAINEQSLIWCGKHPDFYPREVCCVFDDRTMVGDWMFAGMQRAAGRFTPKQWGAYSSTYCEIKPYCYSGLVLVDASAEASQLRVKQRGEPSEAGMPLGYLQDLRAVHYMQYRSIAQGGQVPILYLHNEPFVEPSFFLRRLCKIPTGSETARLWRDTPPLTMHSPPAEISAAFKGVEEAYERFFVKKQK
jgi:deoxyadenosine/deoxycytidine kinase